METMELSFGCRKHDNELSISHTWVMGIKEENRGISVHTSSVLLKLHYLKITTK